jgi:hypothetical protein
MPERICQRPGCGRSIPSRKRRDARWCSRSCESKARRQAARRAAFEAANPDSAQLLGAESQSLTELHDHAGRPAHWAEIEAAVVDDDLIEHTDFHDVGVYEHEHQDDEAGIVAGDSAPDPWQERNEWFAAEQALSDAIDAVQKDFDRKARPFIEQQRRNQGIKLPQLAALERERHARIRHLEREHYLADAHRQAARDRPRRIATAHERQVERAAARALAMDLGRGRFLRDEPADVGRPTSDIAIW